MEKTSYPQNKLRLVISIPAYNEEMTVGEVIKNIPPEIAGISEKRVLVINDGSTDDTERKAKEAGAEVVSHSGNKGLGVAFSTAVRESLSRRADVMVSIDADGQFDPRDIPKLLNPILEGKADCVIGSRFTGGYRIPGIPKIKLRGNKLMAKFIGLICGKSFFDVSSGFRAYSKEALLDLNLSGKFTYTQESILNLTFKGLKITEVPIKVSYFPARKSFISGNLLKYVFNAMKIILQTIIYYKPLKFLGGFGAVLLFSGLLPRAITFFRSGKFLPFTSSDAFSLIFIVFGFVFLLIGLVAEISHSSRQIKEKTLYHQKKKNYYA